MEDSEKIKSAKDEISANVKWERILPPLPTGGQQCGLRISRGVVLKSEELELEIKVDYYRNQIDNRAFALKLFELALDELIK